MSTLAVRALVGAALLAAAAACGASPATHTGSAAPARSGPSAAASSPAASASPIVVDGNPIHDHGTRRVSGLTSTTIEVGDFYFAPSVLVGAPGQHLLVHLHDVGQAGHTFTIAAEHVNVVLSAGQRATVTVTFPAHGKLPFICQYHIGAGMAGLLETG